MEQETRGMLKQSAEMIRQLTQDRDEARAELAGRITRDRAVKVASQMVERGHLAPEDQDEKVLGLVNGSAEDLAVTEKAMEIASAPEGVAKLASVGEDPAGDGLSLFEQAILSHGRVSDDVPTDFSNVA